MLEAIESFWLAEYLRRSILAYPIVNAAHIFFLGALVTSAILMDLRVLGLGAGIAVKSVIAHLRPVAMSALAGAVLTGLLLFSVQPRTYAANPVFWMKMSVLAIAVTNAGLFTFGRLHHKSGAPLARLMAIASIALWLVLLFLGRAIAFFD